MYLLTRHLRPRNTSNHFLSQPQLPLERRRLLRLDISTHRVQPHFDLPPRNSIRRGFDVSTVHKVRNRVSQTTTQTVHQRLDSQLDISHARRTTRLYFKYYSIDAPHPAFGAIVDPVSY